jgi:hypothetical protein
MQRFVIPFALVALLASCASQSSGVKRTTIVDGQRHCVKHHIPRITVRGFEAKPLMLVHSAEARSPQCDEHAPNRIWDSRRLRKTKLHPIQGMVTYCPRCEADYTTCMVDYRPFESDIQQITELISRRKDIRKLILRIVPVDRDRVLVDAGRDQHIGDVFDDVGVRKRHGRWHVSSPIDAHKIVALGR